MKRRSVAQLIFRLFAITGIAFGGLTYAVHPGSSERGPDPEVNQKINYAVEGIWDRVDGQVARGEASQAWLWGPKIVAQSTETYPESPTGTRKLVYYDKGRFDILNVQADAADDWYAVGGLLVREMLSGRVQLGHQFFADRPIPSIPLAGDFGQPQPVTYETLAPYSSVAGSVQDRQLIVSSNERQVADRTGDVVTAYLGGDGALIPNRVLDSGVRYGHFDSLTGHNMADVFTSWVATLPYPDLYILGHPISEPYWIDTIVDGQPMTILIQAFERRILTYNLSNPAGWQVESANVGEHYRSWRGLSPIEDPEYVRLASELPFGEEIVGAALATGVDPFMLAAMSQVLSGGNPAARDDNGGRGLLAVRPTQDDSLAPVGSLDPVSNALQGAFILAQWIPSETDGFDWRAVLANYYARGEVDWNDQGLETFVHDVLETYGAFKYRYPRLEPEVVQRQEVWGGPLESGPAAFYSPSYTTPWWEKTQRLYASIGVIAPEHEPDPNGYYCVRPGYVPGERLRLRANGVTITCTVGDMVADHDLHNWLRVSNWAVELSWSAFTALGLEYNNYVEVDYPGAWAKLPPPIPPPAPTPTPTPDNPAEGTPTISPAPSEGPVGIGEPVVDPASTPIQSPTPDPPSGVDPTATPTT